MTGDLKCWLHCCTWRRIRNMRVLWVWIWRQAHKWLDLLFKFQVSIVWFVRLMKRKKDNLKFKKDIWLLSRCCMSNKGCITTEEIVWIEKVVGGAYCNKSLCRWGRCHFGAFFPVQQSKQLTKNCISQKMKDLSVIQEKQKNRK